VKFETLNLDKRLLDGIRDMGYERCTPVQEQSLPESLAGHDVSVQAQTGTGKTAVFLLTILQRMITVERDSKRLRALILVPTRELAVQVESQAKEFCGHLPFRTVSIYGGVGYDKQLAELRKGVQIVVATPGRLIDLVKGKSVDLSKLEFMVLDEADRMFDMGFMPDVRYILKRVPHRSKRQTMIFSATLDRRIRQIGSLYMRKAVEVAIEPDQVTVGKVEQKVFHVAREEKIPLLLALLRREEMPKVLIFTNMKRTAERVCAKLNGNGINAEVITGDVNQKKRLSLISGLQKGKIKVLVATDVAARGLHIDDISHVINYDLPTEVNNYVHRIGRTARAGAHGKAYTIACEDLVEYLPEVERFIEQKIDVRHIDFDLPEDKSPRYHHPARVRRPARVRSAGPPPDRKKSSAKKKVAAPIKKRAKQTGGKRPKQMSKQERLDYYGKKYGESFKSGKTASSGKRDERAAAPSREPSGRTAKSKKGILKTLFTAFKKPRKNR
jgi:ATP-dependent RNA helicase RhlB